MDNSTPQANTATIIASGAEEEIVWDGEYLRSGQWKLVLGQIQEVSENPEFAMILHRTLSQQFLALGYTLPEELKYWDKMSVAQRLIFLRVNLHMISGLVVLVGKELERITP